MTDYKVLVGKTKMPLKQQKGIEKKMVDNWQNVYNDIRQKRKNNETFVLHDGPPYANGDIHIGHALNKIIKDITVRYQVLLGKNIHYQPGWDCHGLPIEWKVEEKYRKNKMNKDDDVIAFRDDCRKYASEWLDKQREQFKTLGVLTDWSNPYLTMNYSSEAETVRKLHAFLMQDMIYKSYRPVMWSPIEKTSLAEAEVEHHDIKTDSMYVEFPLVTKTSDGSGWIDTKGASVVIWTTTPWTLPANRAVAYSQTIDYVLVDATKNNTTKQFVIAVNLINDFEKNTGFSCVVKTTFDLSDAILLHPIYKTERPLLAADFVKDDVGTGFVHIAPAHGEDDFKLGKKYQLDYESSVDDDGLMTLEPFKGIHVYKGNDAVKEELGDNLVAIHTITHSYPHSWRSNKPIIFKTTPQWFISLEQLRQKSLDALENVEFVQNVGRNRITTMLKNRGDWCISRQRSWGVPLMLFVDKNGNILKDESVNTKIYETVETLGCDAWFNLPNEYYLGKMANDYTKVMDVLDVWFDSGSTFSFTLEKEGLFPADLYLEGSDQHRGWFQSSLLIGVASNNVAPYKKLLTHGFVLDGNGIKMSKSKGNVINPDDVITKYGVDVLRVWVASSDYTDDVRLSMNNIETTVSDVLSKLRNTLRFIIMNLNDNAKVENIEYNNMPELEKFMLYKVFQLNKNLMAYLENYEYHKILSELHKFCSGDLSSYYFTMKKDSLYCDGEKSLTRMSCVTVLNILFNFLTEWLSPIIPFTIDEIHQLRNDCNSGDVFLKSFSNVPEEWGTYNDLEKWNVLNDVRNTVLVEIEKLRSSKEVGSSSEVIVGTCLLNDIDTTGINLNDFFGVSAVSLLKDKTETNEMIVKKITGEKCPRCWTYHPKLENDLCPRCNDVVLKG